MTIRELESARSNRKTTDVDRFVGARVKAARMNQGWSQTALAERLGVSFQQVQKYEKGSNRISAAAMVTIAGLFELPLSYFLGEQEAVANGKDPEAKAMPASRLEFRLLSAFRNCPPSLQARFIALMEAAAGLQPDDQ
ncbi:helix-turn-helix transcriptional regulator [Rhizobium sp. BG4]|uniref:helix-turn-helix domain-containing protein n=1 Tax=Rhizobium sp. BG4 TaxID=2613770 RepID=UPI00193E7C84|nr:helix-turn-helix transcriptional regulator [Rhizobium sp. BG4]QRM47235.1 helix-turn-helix transcriptional regulator [Rhizobium sp. BG4]